MAIEKEIKLKIDLDIAKNILNNLLFKIEKATLQKTIRRDTEDLKYERSGIFLRTREEDKEKVVTLKKKVTTDSGIFEREEYETNVGDVTVLNEIFEKLGLTKSWIMEKFRIQGTYNDLTLCLDEVCFGIFLEIEEEESEIVGVLKDLSLDFNEKITVPYWELWEVYKKENGLDDSLRDILFGDKEIALQNLAQGNVNLVWSILKSKVLNIYQLLLTQI